MNALKSIPPKKALSLAGGVFAVITGLRDLRKNSGKGRLAMVHTLLKITVALVGVVVALKAVDEIAEDA
ncbi:MAG: hypothetical protein QOF82_1830 [Frankiales bacterium]|jgi:hypothetical protein|nr:hypothetical protein [Frankiales bacterium]MDX6257443.1 hypothetical protein [Frankiales bacterium]